jgi:hypothetical protein
MRHLLASAAPFFAVSVFAAAAAAQAQPAQTADAVLTASHGAVGAAPATGGAEYDYSYEGNGLTGTRTDIADQATGAFVTSMQAGEIGEGHGYDGRTPWMRDVSGANTSQEGGDRVQLAVNDAYRYANLWWRPDHGGATITYVGRETLDGRSLDHLVVTPKGGKRFDAWFDADSHLLDRIAEDRMFFHTRTLFADYRPEAGAALPHTVTVDSGAGEASYEHLKLTGFKMAAVRPLSAYARPTAPPVGASIDRGAASVTVPFRLLNNHIYVQAMVNGKGPYTFIVDTGGHTLLSHRVVSETGLKSVGESVSSGAGEGHSTIGFAHVDDIAIGALHLRNQVGFVTEVYDRSIEGIPVDGMVGFELIRRMVTRVDYGGQTITFTDPKRFDPRGAGTAVPFKFYEHLPFVEGLLDDLPAKFDIDTGSRSEVDFTSPFVAAHQLRSRFPKGVSAVTGWGVGGPSRAYTVRIPSMTLGTVKVDNPTAGLGEDKGGSMSDPNFGGNVGSAFLKRFVVTFDYAHQVMYLKRITPEPVDAGRFDRSGMWINAKPDGYIVTDVSAGGPAAQAGIAVNDLIVSLDGEPVRPEGLSDARILLRAKPAGTKVRVVLKRGGDTHAVTLVLRDQI